MNDAQEKSSEPSDLQSVLFVAESQLSRYYNLSLVALADLFERAKGGDSAACKTLRDVSTALVFTLGKMPSEPSSAVEAVVLLDAEENSDLSF